MLPADAFTELRDFGALLVAYCQLLSMQHLARLGQLAKTHAQADAGDGTFSLVLNNPQGADFPAGQVELTAQRTIIDDISLVGVTHLTGELFG